MSPASADRERTVSIQNKYGLHARPAAEFVKLANRYQCDIWVRKEEIEEACRNDFAPEESRWVSGKSIMGVMMLAAECGSTITIRAAGNDAEAAIEMLAALVESRFGEE